MKTFAKAALVSAVMLTALNGTPGAEAQQGRCDDDAPGVGGCGDNGATASPNTESDGDGGDPRLNTMAVLKSLVFDQSTVSDTQIG